MDIPTQDEIIDYKKVEALLNEYRSIPTRIRRNELEIKIIEKTYEGVKGKSNNEIMAGSRTNQTTNSVEDALLAKEHKIERLREENEMLLIKKEMVENAYNSLGKDEKGIIASRYFDDVSVIEIANNLDITEDGVYKACRRIIEKKLIKYIVLL